MIFSTFSDLSLPHAEVLTAGTAFKKGKYNALKQTLKNLSNLYVNQNGFAGYILCAKPAVHLDSQSEEHLGSL